MFTVYHYPGCSTCRKALVWLDRHGIEAERVDLVKHPPTQEALARVLRLADLPVQKLFSTSGELYRSGNYKERLQTLSKADALAELAAHGKLIKRPILLGEGVALVGFKEADWERALL